MTFPALATIPDLPAGTTPSGSEPIESVQNNSSVKLTVTQIATSIPAGTVTNAMLATAPALTVKGNPTNATASVQDVAGTANQVLRVNSAGTSWSWGQVNLASASAITGSLLVVNGGTGIGTYTLGDTLYSDAANSLAKLAGNITATRQFLRQTGSGAVSAAPAWDTILAADIPSSALTKVDDTNITLTLGGSPGTALLAATSLTLGFTGTLAAGRLNANVVQSVVNDTNVTGSIATQALTLGWTGTLAVGRGGIGVGTLTNHGVLLGQSTSAVVATAVMTNGQLLVGQSAADPLPKTITGDIAMAASGATTLRNSAALSVIGQSANSIGTPADISTTAASAAVLRESGSTIGFGTIATAGIGASQVTYAKIQNESASTLLGNPTGGATAPSEITLNGTLTFTGTSVQRAALTGDATASAGSNTVTVLQASTTWALPGDTSPAQITADQNDYNPANLSTSSTLRLSSDATRNITGLAGGADGRILIIHNIGTTNAIVLKDESASSTAANRFALTADVTLSPDSVVELQYDSTSTRWRCIGGSGGGGGGAASTEAYVTIGNTAGLSAERALTGGTGITIADGGANTTATINSTMASQADQEAASSNTVHVTPGVQHFHPSAMKSWVRFNSAAAIQASYNTTSVTDNGVGDWTINIGNDHSSANYFASALGYQPADPNDSVVSMGVKSDVAAAAGTFRLVQQSISSALVFGRIDPPTNADIWFGTAGDL